MTLRQDAENTTSKKNPSQSSLSHLKTTSNDQFLAFRVEEEKYLLETPFLREIIMLPFISRIQNPLLEGLISLRQEILPVLSLRRLLKLPAIEYSPQARIIIVTLKGEGDFGIIVDEISDFFRIKKEDIQLKTDWFSKDLDLFKGIGKTAEGLRGIIDPHKILEKIKMPSLCQEDFSGDYYDRKIVGSKKNL